MNFIFSLVLCLAMLIVSYIPYIIFIGIFAMVIKAITTKKIASKTLKTLIVIVILLYATIIIGGYQKETSDNTYTKIKEISDNKSLIGLSEEEVVKLLGEPRYQYTDKQNKVNYTYGAGTIRKEWYWGECYSTKYYQLEIMFDESGKVKYAYIKESA